MVAAPAAGLVEMEVLMCLGVVLICLACVITRLPWVLDKVTASVEKQFGPSAVYLFLLDSTISRSVLRVSSKWRHKTAIRRMRSGNGDAPQPSGSFSPLGVIYIGALR